MENQAVAPSFKDDTCRHRAGKDKKFHPDKSGPKRGGGQLAPLCHTVEPLEKATSDALLFADFAPRKTAVCRHQTGQKEGLVPLPRQPATRPGAGTQDLGQFASNKPCRQAAGLAVCKNTYTYPLTRTPCAEG